MKFILVTVQVLERAPSVYKKVKKEWGVIYVMLNKGLDKGNLSYIDQVKNTLADCGVLEKMKRRRKWTTQDSTWNL